MNRFILTGAAATLGLTLSLTSQASLTEPTLTQGAVVRIQSNSIEDGWHAGRMQLDARKCWMVKLDRPTRDHYTLLALLVVDVLQVPVHGDWTGVDVKHLLQATPPACLEEGSD